jgi:hypothetical protein
MEDECGGVVHESEEFEKFGCEAGVRDDPHPRALGVEKLSVGHRFSIDEHRPLDRAFNTQMTSGLEAPGSRSSFLEIQGCVRPLVGNAAGRRDRPQSHGSAYRDAYFSVAIVNARSSRARSNGLLKRGPSARRSTLLF